MTEAISQFFLNTFGSNAWVATFLIAIVPLIELKGAIPFGMSKAFWAEHALSSWASFGVSLAGSAIIVPIIALIFKPIVVWLDKYRFFHAIISFFTDDIKQKSKSLLNQQSETRRAILLKMASVIVFVAFPVPLTGVWVGTCFAVLLGLNFWQVCISVIGGNVLCGLIVTCICCIFPNATSIILYIFIVLLVVAVAVKVTLHIIKKRKAKKEEIDKK